MMIDAELMEAAREACTRCKAWLDSDGIFPEPEYDDFLAAMHNLSVVCGMEEVRLPKTGGPTGRKDNP